MSVVSSVKNSPKCPKCGDMMSARKSKFGDFWGCVNFPQCRGTRDIKIDATTIAAQTTEYEPQGKIKGSEEQEAIWDFMVSGKAHMIIKAGPGTGKSFSLMQGCLRLSRTQKILVMAFNKHIEKELSGKFGASGLTNVAVRTFHSYGYGILRQAYSTLGKPDENKMTDILESLSPPPLYGKAQWRKTLNLAKKLCAFSKNYMLDHHSFGFASELETIADHHSLDFYVPGRGVVPSSSNGDSDLPGNFTEAMKLVPLALDECINRASVSADFDDLLWLPVVLNLPFNQFEITMTDESQDLNVLQHEMTLRSCKSGRIFVVGDPHQSIYGFRGASVNSMEVLEKTLKETTRGVKTFPLTITRRCPKLHVQMALSLYPEIQALEEAPLGEIVIKKSREETIEAMHPGDLVICRVTKELISVAYKLIRRGVKPVIKGREFGKGLITFLDTLIKRSGINSEINVVALPEQMKMLNEALSSYRYEEQSKLLPLGDKAEGRLQNLADKCDCMAEFVTNSTSLEELRQRIHTLFSDESEIKDAVILGTVHRTKGLEAERVFVLAPELIPHPMAKSKWEQTQERNLAWVACTRAKFTSSAPGTLIFDGFIPTLFSAPAVSALPPQTGRLNSAKPSLDTTSVKQVA